MIGLKSFVKKEYTFIASVILYLLFLFIKISPVLHSNFFNIIIAFIVFIFMLLCAFNVVKQADWLAEKFGEPYGTLILTISVICIEVGLIVTMMLVGKGGLTLARDTMFAVIMIAVNGFAGLSLLIGGIKHKSQKFNIEGSTAYVAILIPLITLCLILPNFTKSTAFGTFSVSQSVIIAIACVVLYFIFLIKQTVTHKEYFQFSLSRPENDIDNNKHTLTGSITYHVILLLLGLLVMILLSKSLSLFLNFSIQKAGLPEALGGVIIAMLVLIPEGFSAIQAAYKNELQRSINLCMGGAVATICLTVPAITIISLSLGKTIILGLSPANIVLVILTFFITLVIFTAKKSSAMFGAILLSVFIVYIALIFDIR